ncbi:hypothetical protein Btru_005511 [Bulinus truncatus]|nr:hypothetical protein Btru_005511 [Bulinus truncatus]
MLPGVAIVSVWPLYGRIWPAALRMIISTIAELDCTQSTIVCKQFEIRYQPYFSLKMDKRWTNSKRLRTLETWPCLVLQMKLSSHRSYWPSFYKVFRTLVRYCKTMAPTWEDLAKAMSGQPVLIADRDYANIKVYVMKMR